MKVLTELQNWYKSNCNGEWEHSYGLQIESLDNPGWSIKIDLTNTKLANKHFAGIDFNNSDNDWIVCKVENLRFLGYGDSQKLEKILRVFLDWLNK